jgi:hypothetical protein
MKTIRLFGLMAVVLCTIAAYQARAQYFTFYFDEDGHGSWSAASLPGSSGPGTYSLTGTMMADPTQSGIPSVLTYMLPIGQIGSGGQGIGLVKSGDVAVWENTGETVLSDWLRFTDANGDLNGLFNADRMIYYSDLPDGDVNEVVSLADTGFPTGTTYNIGNVIEQPQPQETLVNGFEWDPGGPNNNICIGISDVPEPASFGLMILGGLLGLRRLLWRKQS